MSRCPKVRPGSEWTVAIAPHQPLPDHQRGRHHGLDGAPDVLRGAATPLLVARDDQRLVGLRHVPHRALAERHPGPDGVGPHVVPRDDDELLRLLVEDGELPSRHVEEGDRAPEHRLEELVELQLPRELGEGVEKGALFGEALALGRKEARATDGDPRLVGRGGEDVEVPCSKTLPWSRCTTTSPMALWSIRSGSFSSARSTPPTWKVPDRARSVGSKALAPAR